MCSVSWKPVKAFVIFIRFHGLHCYADQCLSRQYVLIKLSASSSSLRLWSRLPDVATSRPSFHELLKLLYSV